MEAQANTTRKQSYKNNIYDEGWRPSQGENGGGGKKKNDSTYTQAAFPVQVNVQTISMVINMHQIEMVKLGGNIVG